MTPDAAFVPTNKVGWNRFPAYPDDTTAEARYQQMHRYMDQDVANTYGRR